MRALIEALIDRMIELGIQLPDAVAEFEKKFIQRVLEETNGNHSKAAQALGIHRNTLTRKLKRYGLDHRPKRRKRASR